VSNVVTDNQEIVDAVTVDNNNTSFEITEFRTEKFENADDGDISCIDGCSESSEVMEIFRIFRDVR
jgi:hypothetical protein